MKKINYYQIIPYLITTLVVLLNVLVLRPYVNLYYDDKQVIEFKKSSWFFTIVLALLLLIALIIYAYKKRKLNKPFLLNSLFVAVLFAFFIKIWIDDALLYINSKFDNGTIAKSYTIRKYEDLDAPLIYDNKKEILFSKDQLEKIEATRKMKNLKSIYSLNDKDTININFKTGFLKINYLEI
jgi:hypothetical protein